MRSDDAVRLGLTLALSLGGHLLVALLLVLLPMRPTLPDIPPPPLVEVVDISAVDEPPPRSEPEPEVQAPEEPPPEPAAVLPVEPPPRPEPRVRPTREPPPPSPEPPASPPPQAETVADFTGMTMTNTGGASWQSNVGSGAPMEGPIGAPNAAVTGRRRQGRAGGVPGGTGEDEGARVVAGNDLSRQPGPPNERLIVLLEQNYPREAQQLGVEGYADVRVHVHADGRVRPVAVVRQTQDGFGEACRRTLRQGGSWSPPLDRGGNPVDTVTVFRCTFSIRF